MDNLILNRRTDRVVIDDNNSNNNERICRLTQSGTQSEKESKNIKKSVDLII